MDIKYRSVPCKRATQIKSNIMGGAVVIVMAFLLAFLRIRSLVNQLIDMLKMR